MTAPSNKAASAPQYLPANKGRKVAYFPTTFDRTKSEMQVGRDAWLAADVVAADYDNPWLLNIVVRDRVGREFPMIGVPFVLGAPQGVDGGYCMWPNIPAGARPEDVERLRVAAVERIREEARVEAERLAREDVAKESQPKPDELPEEPSVERPPE